MSNSGEIKLENSASSITMDAVGSITINQALMIKLGDGASIPCPDALTCLVTGAPLATGTFNSWSTSFCSLERKYVIKYYRFKKHNN